MRLVLVLCLFYSSLTFAQTTTSGDTVFNQTDAKGLKQGYWKGFYESKKIKYIGYFKDNKPVGTFKRFYDDGVIKALMVYNASGTKAFTTLYYQNGVKAAEGNYVGTVKDSIWNYYSYYDKTLSNRENYVKGKREGVSESYFSSGKKSQELEYKNDLKNGIWHQYYENGTVKISATYSNGKRIGPFVVNYPDGKPEWRGNYVSDVKTGKWTLFNPDGSINSEIEFVNGIAKNSQELERKESKQLELIEKIKGSIPEPDENSFIPGSGM